jgi:hypothetical protein
LGGGDNCGFEEQRQPVETTLGKSDDCDFMMAASVEAVEVEAPVFRT